MIDNTRTPNLYEKYSLTSREKNKKINSKIIQKAIQSRKTQVL